MGRVGVGVRIRVVPQVLLTTATPLLLLLHYSRTDYDQVLAPLAVGLWDAVTLAYGRADLVRVRVRVRVR